MPRKVPGNRTTLKRHISPPEWVPLTAILLVVIGVAALFLTPAYQEFPMDDTYIHLVYAENLAETGKLFFSFPDETGVGVTSILWVLLLAAGHLSGISTNFLAKFLGVLSLATVAVGLYALLRAKLGRPLAFLTVFLAVVVGNLAWFAVSGMETMLFLALGILALLAYRHERWGWVGIALGLLTLTRPEGLALACSLFLVEFLQKKRLPRSLIVAAGIMALIAGPWFFYLYVRSGHFLPTSGVGKHLTHRYALAYIFTRNPTFSVLGSLPFLTYTATWAAYLSGFTFGGVALPAPALILGPFNGIPEISISAWAPLAWILITALLCLAARRGLALRRWPERFRDQTQRPLLILLAWTTLHNLVYIAYMPVPGTASRYGALNHIFIWIAIIYGLRELSSRRTLQFGAAAVLIALALNNMMYWDSVYTANIEHMESVRIRSAQYIRNSIPAGELCAASDIGAIRYHSGRPILDLGALVDPEAGRYFLNGKGDQYLVDHNSSCLVIPGRTGASDEGWLDLVAILGFDKTELFTLEPVAVFAIPQDRWLLGYLPTNNYQASIHIYKVALNGAQISQSEVVVK